MNKKNIIPGILAAVLLIGLLAAAGYNWLLGPTLEATSAITAVPLDLAAATQPEAEAATAQDAAAGLIVLQISQAESEVRFTLTEELRGQPTTVVGASNQVAGQFAVDPSDLSTAQVGVIQVNARTLATENDRRNQAIRNQILSTDDFEYITFAPTDIIGLEGSAEVGSTFSFQIAGDLTIRGTTQPVVFDVTATADALDTLSGTATVTIQRSDYGLTIPSVPNVANVSQAVELAIDFVAKSS